MPNQQSKEQKWLRVLERAKIVAKLEAPHQQRFLALMKNMQVASREQAGGEGRPEYALEKVRLAAKRRAVRELNAQRSNVVAPEIITMPLEPVAPTMVRFRS